MFRQKDFLGLKDCPLELLEYILSAAFDMKKILLSGKKKISLMEGKSVFLLFYESSTRTASSFDDAAKILGANSFNLSIKTSSVNKGESLIDTGMNIDRMQADVIVIRHRSSGAPALLARNVNAAVINAGDGLNEHPTQAMLDIMTLKERFGELKGLKIALIGDIKHSRVARSNIWGLTKLGAQVTLCAPATLMPLDIDKLPVKIASTKEEAVKGANAIMGLRIQLERQDRGLFPDIAEYHKFFGIDESLLKYTGIKDTVLMHPGPLNRGAELTSEAADGGQSVILSQVTNGVAVRMALLAYLTNSLKSDNIKNIKKL